MVRVLEWRHPSFYLAYGWPLHLDIEEKFLDVAATNGGAGVHVAVDPGKPDVNGKPLSDRSRREISRVRAVQRAASAAAVESLHALDLSVTRPMLRGFLHRLAFAFEPLNPPSDLVWKTLADLASVAPQHLIAMLPFSIETAIHPPQDEILKDWPKDLPIVGPILMPFDHEGAPLPTHIWSTGMEGLIRTRLAHERLLEVRKEYLRLASHRHLPSQSYFRARLAMRVRSSLKKLPSGPEDSIEWIVGAAAAECSPWWKEKLEWHLLRGDRALEPRGSYASPDDAPKQLFVWYQFDNWLRRGLGGLATHLDRSRAIAATLMAFAGPALYHPPELEKFARNSVERWRTRKAPSAKTLGGGLFLSVAGFAFTSPRQDK